MRSRRPLGAAMVLAGVGVGLSLNLGGCGTPSVWELLTDTSVFAKGIPNDSPITCPVRVYLLRGLWDVYSIGLDSLADEMRTEIGVDATPVSGTQWKNYIDPIVEEHEAGGDDFQLVLVGHSFGSDNALDLAHALRDRGVPIKLIFLFDSTDPPPIPDNVERVIHLYIPTTLGSNFPRAFAGNPVVAEAGNTRTLVENIVVNEENFGPGVNVANHYQLESNPVLHVFAIDIVEQLCP